MSRIYTGMDALGLGMAVNKLHNGIADRRMNVLDNLAKGIQDAFEQRDREFVENAQKKAAIDLLTGSGEYDKQTAGNMVGALGAGEAARYLTGKLDAKADRADERQYENEIFNRNLKAKRDDYAQQRKDATLDRVFAALNEYRGLINAKAQEGTFPSQSHLEALRNAENDLNEFVKAHPEYAFRAMQQGAESVPEISNEDFFNSDAAPMTTQRAQDRINSLFDENDEVAPEDLDRIDKEFIRNYGRSIYDIPELESLVELATLHQKGGKIDRLAKNTKSGGKNTVSDNVNRQRSAYEDKMLKAYTDAFNKWANDKTKKVKKPIIPAKYLGMMAKKIQDVYRRY